MTDTVCCCYWKRKTQWLRSCLSHSSLSLPNFTVSFLVFLFLYFPLHLFIFHYLSSATVWFKQCNVALHSSVFSVLHSKMLNAAVACNVLGVISFNPNSKFCVLINFFSFALIAFGFVCVGERDSRRRTLTSVSINCFLILLNFLHITFALFIKKERKIIVLRVSFLRFYFLYYEIIEKQKH